MEINFFDKYILRVPLLSLNNLEIFNKDSIIKTFRQSEVLQEALFLSSPELFYEVKKELYLQLFLLTVLHLLLN